MRTGEERYCGWCKDANTPETDEPCKSCVNDPAHPNWVSNEEDAGIQKGDE